MRSQRAPSLARAEAQPAEREATQPKGRSPVTSSAFPRNSAPQGKAWRTLSVEPPHNIIPPLHHCRFKNHLRRKNNPAGRKSELERGGALLLPRDRDPAIERGIRKGFSTRRKVKASVSRCVSYFPLAGASEWTICHFGKRFISTYRNRNFIL